MPIKHIRLTPEREERLVAWLVEQIDDIENGRTTRENNWRRWREQYEGKTQPKTFPWKGASNVHVPITAINVDAIHANMMNRLFGFDRVWDVTAVSTGEVLGVNARTGQPITWTDLAGACTNYLAYESGATGQMDVYDVLEQAALEAVKLGTAIVFQPWMTLTRPDFEFIPETGDYVRKSEVTVFDGVKPQVIPLEDFLIMRGYPEIDGPFGSPLVGHRYFLRPGQVMERVRAGWFRAKAAKESEGASGPFATDVIKDSQSAIEGEWADLATLKRDDHQLYDLWVRFDVDGDGLEESLFVTFHRMASRLLRVQPFLYKRIPYTAMRYIRRENRFYGIGVPEMLETLQAGCNTSFNQAVDNATVANTRMWGVRKGSTSAKYLDDIYPSKKVLFDDEKDIRELQLGEVYPSIFEVGVLFRDYAERRTGVSDYNLGRESNLAGGKHGTATTTLALLQESSRRFDLYAKDIRKAVGEIGMQALELIQQFKPAGRIYAIMGAEGQLVEKALLLPSQVNLREHLVVSTTASSSSSNREVAKQNALQGFAIMTQYFDKLFQLGAMISNPQVPPGLKKLAYGMGEASERLVTRVLEGFDLKDAAAFMPQLEEVYAESRQQAAQGVGGAPGMAAPPGAGPGMAGPGPGGPAGAGGPAIGPRGAGPMAAGAGIPGVGGEPGGGPGGGGAPA